MCELLDPDANGKNGNGLRNIESSIALEFKCAGNRSDTACTIKFFELNRLLVGRAGLPKMDLAATISTLNLDSSITVEENIISKSEKSQKSQYGQKHQPRPDLENDSDYKDLKQYRKNFKESVKQVKNNERNDLRLHALYKEEIMLAEHAARREERKANEKTEEEKEEARKFYAERREKIKRRETIKNKGNLGPLDFDNDLTMDKRLRYFNKHHKCPCGKRFNIIFKGKEGYIVRCSHKLEVPSRVSTSKKCLSCGASNLEIQATPCKCKNYFCMRCKGSNYFYKDVEDPESKIKCLAHQVYDCHPGSNALNDVHLTIKVPDHHIETSEGPCPVVGTYKDVVFRQNELEREIARTNVKKSRTGSRRRFLKTLNGDLQNFSWAERVSGVKTKNNYEVLDVEEVSVEESEEQGGMVSTAMASSKAATKTAYNSVKDAITKLLKEVCHLKDKMSKKITDKASSIIKSALAERFDMVIFFLDMIYANLDFEVMGNLAFILARCFVNGTFSWSSILLNGAQLGMIAYHIATKTLEQLEILKTLEIPMPKRWAVKYFSNERNVLDAATLFIEEYSKTEEDANEENIPEENDFSKRVKDSLSKVSVLKPIVLRLYKDPANLARLIDISCVGGKQVVTFNNTGIAYIRNKTLSSMLKLIGEVEESGNTGLEGICDCIKTTFVGLFSNSTLTDFLKFMRNVSPLFAVYRGGKELVKDISKAITRFILGDLPPAEWLDKEMYDEDSPVHKLYSVYLAYVSTTVPGASNYFNATTSEMRTTFYQCKDKCDSYVFENKKWSSKYSSWIRYMENGLATPPQPREREFEPTVLVLHGPPGVGKSTIWPHIVGYALSMTPKAVRESTHTWNGASEYQPGMADKKIILFDDFGQDRTKNDETLNLIRLCTAAPFMVNSANIVGAEIKGMFAQPEVIVICTNDPELATDKIFSGPAVVRRMDLYLTMSGKLDFSQENVAEIPHFYVNQCGRYSEINSKTLSLAHVSGLMKVIHKAKIDSFKKINRDLEVTFGNIDLETIISGGKSRLGTLPEFVLSSGCLKEEWTKYLKSEDPEDVLVNAAEGKSEVQTLVKDTRPQDAEIIRDQLEKFIVNLTAQDVMKAWFEPYSQLPLMRTFVMDELLEISKGKGIGSIKSNAKRAEGMMHMFSGMIPRRSKDYDSDIEIVKEESLTFPYMVSQASMFLLNVANTAVMFSLPTYVIAGYVSMTTDMLKFFGRPSVGGAFRIMVKVIAVSIGGVCLAFAAYKALSYLGGNSTEESGATKTARARTPELIVNSIAQSGINDNIVKLVKSATGTLIANNGRQINCIAIGGQWILTAMHFFSDFTTKDGILKEGSEIACIMSNGAQIVSFKFEKKRFVQFENHTELFDGAPVRPDIALYRMEEKTFPPYKSLIKHFWDGSYNTKNIPVVKVDYIPKVEIGGERADLVGNLKCDFTNTEFEMCTGFVEEDQVMTVRTKGFDRYYHCVATASYKGRDKSCGSAVMRTDVQNESILGIHVAAIMRNGHSMFHFVTKGELVKATSSHVMVTIQESPFVNYGADLQYQSDLPDTHQFYYLGTTDKKHRVFQPIKTDLQPSLLYDSIHPHITEPSLLHSKDSRIPQEKQKDFWPTMLEGYSKYTNLTFEEIEEAVESVITDNRKLQHKNRTTPRVLTDDEVLNGSVDFPTLGRVPMDTSCGWPYTCEGVKKKHLIDEIGDSLYMKDRLKSDWKDAERCLEEGIVPFLPFTATIKDERVKLKKIYDTPKSRIFMAGNVVNYMLNRKYYGWFLDMHSKTQWSYAITCLDRVSVEWHYFISSMIEVGPHGFDGDFKWWDKFINSVLKYAAFLIDIDGLVTSKIIERDSPKYCALREMKVRTIVIFGEAVYLSNGIEPSGELLTFMDNCSMNEVVHRTAYLCIMRKLSPMDGNIPAYKNKTRGGRAGDDTIQMVAEAILKYFNGRTFSDWCKSKNISLTGADKSENVAEFTHFKSLQFVKNTTGVMHGYYVPQQDIEELVEQAYWVRLNANNKDIVKATEDNTNAALRGIYYWGKDTFNKIRSVFLDKAPQLNLLTFADLDLQWKKYGFFPGSHSDYATQTDQDPMRKFKPSVLNSKSLMKYQENNSKFGQISIRNIEMKIIESIEQAAVITGKDKSSMNVDATHPSASLDESVPPKTVNDVPPATTSNVVGSESQVNGAFIQSKEDPVRQQLRTGKITVSPSDFRAQGHLNDKNWTLAKLASKFTSLGQISWPISAAPGTILKKWNLPNEILTTPALKTPFDVTAYERFQNITFKITTSASPFYAGRLICGFYPSMQFEPPSINPSNLHLTLTQLGGVVLNPTDNQTVEYSIPYRHYLNWLEYPKDFVGQFYVVVMNSLKTGASNINNVTISVFVSVENAQFKVPEYIGTTTKSQEYYKMISSIPQSGDVDGMEDTAIVVSKKVNTVNEDFQSNATMMCAGTGVYVEPTVKQFPDHPIDLIQLLKRDNVFTYEKFKLQGSVDIQPGFISVLYPYNDIFTAVTRETGDIFAMFRGSLMIKASFFGFEAEDGKPASDCWEAKAFYINQDVPVTYPGSIEDFNYFAKLNLGYHKFDQLHPACFTVPHWSPNFASFNRGESVVNENPISWIVLEFYNWSPKEIVIKGVIEARVDDDFSMGVFTGMGGMSFSPVPPPSNTFRKARKIRSGPPKMRSNDGNDYIVINSRLQGGNIIDSAQEWVTGKAQDIASGIIKTGVDSVFDLARENLEPVMDIVDMVGNLLDAPPVTLQAAPYMPRKWNYGNANNIMQYAEKLGATNHNGGSYSDKTTYGTNVIETNLYDLCTNVKTLWKTISWSTSNTAGSLLNYFAVGCNGTEDVLNNNSKVACPMDMFSRFFNYWSGSIIYALDVVSSQMHTGRLVVSFHPNLSSLPQGFTLDQATQQYFLSFDLDKGKGCAVIEIPYLFKRPFKPVPLFDSVGTAGYPFTDGFNGIVCIWVMNPLRASETVSTTVDINLYKMAGKDFRFEGYGSIINASMKLN